MSAKTKRSDRLLAVASKFDHVLIIAHDNPDPDAIASGWAIHYLLDKCGQTRSQLVGGGDVIRAENREMLRVLGPPLELIPELQVNGDAGLILVDCGMGAQNHLLRSDRTAPVAVIDHHQLLAASQPVAFRDIRPRVAASASIVSSYLREQDLTPPDRLATALLYAIRTETRHAEIRLAPLDRRMVTWLTSLANLEHLAAIENAPLSPEYFSDLALALQNTFTFDTAALCFLPRAQGGEIIGEVSDLLVRCETIKKVLCAARIGDDVLLSVRTDVGMGNAAELVQAVVAGIGQGGGHMHRAGGKIAGVSDRPGPVADIYEDLRARWLKACHIDRERGTRLVARREIVSNL